jgi:F-type H+-transporting ATPase subunit b
VLSYDTALEELTGDDVFALAAQTEEHSETDAVKEETVNPVLPTGSDIVYAVIFFFALWAALKFVLLPPVQKVRAERAAKIAAARDAADNASADMGSAQADYDAALVGARTEAASILDAARADADAHRSQVMGAAEAEVAELRAAAEAEIARARTQAIGSLSRDVAQVAASAASTVIGRVVEPELAQPIADRSLQGGGA